MDVVVLVRFSYMIGTTSGTYVDHVVRKHVVQGTLSVFVVIVVLDHMVGNEAVDWQGFRSVKRKINNLLQCNISMRFFVETAQN